MKAEIKNLFSLDIDNLKNYIPENPKNFQLSLRLVAGPEGAEGEESFDIIVCTPSWLEGELDKRGITMGRHCLFMNCYDYDGLVSYIKSYCDKSTGSSWQEIAEKLSRLGQWEFEDYKP